MLKFTVSRELAAVVDDDLGARRTGIASIRLDLLHDVHAGSHRAEDAVLSVQPSGLGGAQEELAAVRVGSGVGHTEDSRAPASRRTDEHSEARVSELMSERGHVREQGCCAPRCSPHPETTDVRVLEHKVLVQELVPIDGLAAGPVAPGEVSSLAHESRNHAVKRGPLEVQRLARAAGSLLARAERPEVLGSLGDHVGAQGHLNATERVAVGGNVEENNCRESVVGR